MTNCKHGIEFITCSYCNGTYEQLEQTRKQYNNDKEEILKLKQRYEEVKIKLKNHYEPWTEEDSEYLYKNFKNISSIRNIKFRKIIYIAAIELGRTRRAIVWHYKHMFIDYGQKKRNEWKYREKYAKS